MCFYNFLWVYYPEYSTTRKERLPMQRRAHLLLTAVLIGLWAMSQAHAFPETIEMKSKAGVVLFSHGKHSGLDNIECESCHHKGMEQTCHDCHKPGVTGPVFNAREALHRQCIGCHKREQAAGKTTGPVADCKGCHQK